MTRVKSGLVSSGGKKMESGRKKRKMGNQEEEEDDEEEEEEKVEKFFALIRSTREMRDRLRNVPNGSKEEEERKKQEEKQVAAVWNPKFQPEDFMEDSKPKNLLAVNEAGPSSNREQEQGQDTKEGGEDGGLDLKLSL
ncbi:NPR1/NH1-interacting protein - like 4 [Theobroma cacao]|nr:NPR1/NH1-interacting protein - like 4 [Theobroma cacao]